MPAIGRGKMNYIYQNHNRINKSNNKYDNKYVIKYCSYELIKICYNV